MRVTSTASALPLTQARLITPWAPWVIRKRLSIPGPSATRLRILPLALPLILRLILAEAIPQHMPEPIRQHTVEDIL
jgi:hypothetical protein